MKKENEMTSVSRRKAIGLLGMGALAVQFPMSCSQTKPKSKDLETQLFYLTIQEVGKLIRTKKISSVELTTIMLNRISTIDTELNSYITIMKEYALSSAKILDDELNDGKYRGPMHGIPIALKDLFYTEGVTTTGGTIVSSMVPKYDATVTSRLKKAGAIIIGKLSMSEGAYLAHHPKFKVPKNPWDKSRYTGVSSSGSGVAVAAGLCFGSLATDTGGSIRYPSSANGVVGLKPTFGRVSRYGVLPLALSMDHVGPMTRSVADAAIMFEAIAGADPNDQVSLRETVPNITSKLDGNIKGVRIGFDRKYSTENVEPQVVEATLAVIDVLVSLGAEIIDVEMPEVGQIVDTWVKIGNKEASKIHSKTYPSRSEDYGEGFKWVMESGLKVTELEFAEANKERSRIAEEFLKMLSNIDAFVCPVMWCAPGVYSAAEVLGGFRPVDPSPLLNDVFAKPADFSGSPSLTVPCGFSKDGAPIGIQFIGNHLDEEMICRIGYAYEQNTEWHNKHPTL